MKMIYPLRVTEAVVPGRHVDLLLYECNGIQHYTTINSFSRLISGQLRNHDGAIYGGKKCLHAYSNVRGWAKVGLILEGSDKVTIKLPPFFPKLDLKG